MRSLVRQPRPTTVGRLARPALALAAVGLIGLAGVTAAAAPPHPTAAAPAFGRQATVLAAGPAARARDRAAGLARALGLRGLPAEPHTVRDTMRGRTVDEVSLTEGQRHTGLIVHDTRTGRPVAVANLAWTPGDEAPRTDRAAAPAAAQRLIRAAGLAVPSGTPNVRWDDAAGAWEVAWSRQVAGIPAPADGLIVRLRPGGALASLSAQESALADAPASPITADAAVAIATTFATDRGLDRLDGFTVDDEGLAWSEPNGFVSGAATFEPTLRLCRVVRLAFVVAGGSSPSLIELRIDAGSGAIVGGDQTS